MNDYSHEIHVSLGLIANALQEKNPLNGGNIARIADALERIADQMADDPDQYEYKRTRWYGNESTIGKFHVDSVESLRLEGWVVFDTDREGVYWMRRLREQNEDHQRNDNWSDNPL